MLLGFDFRFHAQTLPKHMAAGLWTVHHPHSIDTAVDP